MGQGNSIFDAHPTPYESWYNGYLASLSVNPDNTIRLNIIPYIQSNSQIGARKMEENKEETFRQDLQKRFTD
jgi:hypothetical protein